MIESRETPEDIPPTDDPGPAEENEPSESDEE
jgi:hypothetical protein